MKLCERNKKVKCNDCGFIGIIHLSTVEDDFIQRLIKGDVTLSEIPPVGREHLSKMAFDEPASIRCERLQVVWVVNSSAPPEDGLGNRDSISASLKEDRNCPYFFSI